MVFWLCLPLCIANFLTVFAEWINETVNSPFQPVGRSVQAAAWDSASQQLWIHAGNEQLVLEDLWTFDFESRTWDLKQQRRQYRPSARSDHVAVWDPERRSLWIHGGFTGTVGPHNKFFGDLWRYSGNSWTLEADETVYGPSPRSDHVAVWDAASSTLWIHGGKNGHGILLGDLWRFDSPPNRPSWSWSRVVDNEPPSARAHHVAVWDDTNAAIWVHGGYDGGLSGSVLRRDLLKFDTNTNRWTWISNGGPSGRTYHVGAWDPTNLAIWIHGGFDGLARRDHWKFNTQTRIWDLVTEQQGPSRRFNHAAAWDIKSMSFWVHGGYSDGNVARDLWRFHVTTTSTTWTTSSSSSSSRTTSTSKTRTTITSTSSTTISTSSTMTTSSTTKTSSTTSTSTSSTTLSSTTTSKTTTQSTTSSTTPSTTTSITTTSTTTTTTTTQSTTSSTTPSTTTTYSTTTTSHTITTTSKTSTTKTSTTSTTFTSTSSSTISSTSTITRSSSTSSTGTFTTSTSSTVTVTTTACPDLAIAIVCPAVGVLIATLAALVAWRCLRRRFIVIPVPPPLPPPPECIPHPPMLPFPVEEVYVLPLYSCVEALTESAPQARCKSLKGSSCLRLAGFPDLYPRKLCSIAPVRHISIDIKPAAPSFQRVIRPQRGTPTPGPYPNVSSRHCCKEPLRTRNSQPPLRTPPSGGQARPAFQQPEPLLEIIRQVPIVRGARGSLEHLVGDLPCLNLGRGMRRVCQPVLYSYIDMTPQLEHLTVVRTIVEVEEPHAFPMQGPALALRPCLAYEPATQKPRALRLPQSAPSLCVPARTPPYVRLPCFLQTLDPPPCAPLCGPPCVPPMCLPDPPPTPPSPGDPSSRRRSRTQDATSRMKRRDRDRTPGPGFYEPRDQNHFGWIPGLVPGFPHVRRRYD